MGWNFAYTADSIYYLLPHCQSSHISLHSSPKLGTRFSLHFASLFYSQNSKTSLKASQFSCALQIDSTLLVSVKLSPKLTAKKYLEKGKKNKSTKYWGGQHNLKNCEWKKGMFYESFSVGKFRWREKSKVSSRFSESLARTLDTTKLVLLMVIRLRISSSDTLACNTGRILLMQF